MGQEYPTKEEVEKWKYESAHSPLHDHAFENHNRLICLADAYLALREDHKSNVNMWQNIVNKLQKTCEEADAEIEQLKAENQALRARLDKQH